MKFLWLRSLSSILLTIAMIAGFGFLGCKGSFWLVSLVPNDFLSGWTSLGSPPGKALSIQAAASTSPLEQTIVKSSDGNFYAYQPGKSSTWVETKLPFPEQTNLFSECPGFEKPRPGLPSAIVDCKGSYTWEWQNTEDFYAVLEDGTVWRWQYGIDFVVYLSIYGIALIVGAIIGFLLSMPIRKLIFQKIKM